MGLCTRRGWVSRQDPRRYAHPAVLTLWLFCPLPALASHRLLRGPAPRLQPGPLCGDPPHLRVRAAHVSSRGAAAGGRAGRRTTPPPRSKDGRTNEAAAGGARAHATPYQRPCAVPALYPRPLFFLAPPQPPPCFVLLDVSRAGRCLPPSAANALDAFQSASWNLVPCPLYQLSARLDRFGGERGQKDRRWGGVLAGGSRLGGARPVVGCSPRSRRHVVERFTSQAALPLSHCPNPPKAATPAPAASGACRHGRRWRCRCRCAEWPIARGGLPQPACSPSLHPLSAFPARRTVAERLQEGQRDSRPTGSAQPAAADPPAMADPAAPAGEGHPPSQGDHGRVF